VTRRGHLPPCVSSQPSLKPKEDTAQKREVFEELHRKSYPHTVGDLSRPAAVDM